MNEFYQLWTDRLYDNPDPLPQILGGMQFDWFTTYSGSLAGAQAWFIKRILFTYGEEKADYISPWVKEGDDWFCVVKFPANRLFSRRQTLLRITDADIVFEGASEDE